MIPAPPKDRLKLRPGPPKPSRLSTLPISRSTSSGNDAIKSLEKDLHLVTKKLNDLKKLPVEENSSTWNGIGLSNCALSLTKEEEIKFQLTEKIMDKLTELDREVLNITGDTLISRARRSSRDSLLGSDLSCMPAHMTLVDRIMDFHVIIKRNEANNVLNHSSLSRQNSRTSTPNDDSDNQHHLLLREKDKEIVKLKALLMENELEMKAQVKKVAAEKEEALKVLNNHTKLLIEKEKMKTISKQEEIDKLNTLVVTLQAGLKAAITTPLLQLPTRAPEDVQLISTLEARLQQLECSSVATESQIEKLQRQCLGLQQCMEMVADSLSDTAAPAAQAPFMDESLTEEFDNNNHQQTASATTSLLKTVLEMVLALKTQLAEQINLSSNYEAKIKLLMKKHKDDIKQERDACAAVMSGLEAQLLVKQEDLHKLQEEMKTQQVQLSVALDKNTITQQYVEDSSAIKRLQKLLGIANEQISALTHEQQVLTSQVAEFRHAFLDADEKCRDTMFLNRVLTEESARAKEANDDLRKKMSDLTQTYLS